MPTDNPSNGLQKARTAQVAVKEARSDKEVRHEPPSIAPSTIGGSPSPGELEEKIGYPDFVKKDLFFLPIPKYLRYNPSSPTRFDIFTNILFGIASTCSESPPFLSFHPKEVLITVAVIANLYYCQPLLSEHNNAFVIATSLTLCLQ